MRTAILLGLMYIGDKISDISFDDESLKILAWIVVIMMIMDIADFLRGKE